MKRLLHLAAIVFLAACSASAKTFDVDISTGRPAASNEAFYHGETIEFRAVRGRTAVTNIEYSCIFYQTNGMDQAWWKTDGLTFHPTNDVGAASYRFFLEGRDEIGRDWHANGLLRFLPSPGFEPNAIERPVLTLDFASIEVINPPWSDTDLTPATNYTDAVAAALSAAKQDKLPYPTNAIPQSVISGLSTALAGKLDKTGGTMTGSVQFNAGWTAMGDESDTISVGQDAGDGYVRIGETKYRRTGIFTHNANLYFPADSGTLALTSDIPDVSAIGDDATNYTDSAIGAAIANTNPVFSNAVLSVGLGIDTNTVAAINALVEAGDELPIGGVTSVGALLLALAAAVAALKRTKADVSALRYAMPAAVALVAESDAATLVCADRAVTNATIATGFSTLYLTFPTAVSGKVRDFYLRITVAAGESAPALSIPQGITIENPDGAVPEIADGETSAASTTLVWFSETAPGIFTAKSETVKAVA